MLLDFAKPVRVAPVCLSFFCFMLNFLDATPINPRTITIAANITEYDSRLIVVNSTLFIFDSPCANQIITDISISTTWLSANLKASTLSLSAVDSIIIKDWISPSSSYQPLFLVTTAAGNSSTINFEASFTHYGSVSVSSAGNVLFSGQTSFQSEFDLIADSSNFGSGSVIVTPGAKLFSLAPFTLTAADVILFGPISCSSNISIVASAPTVLRVGFDSSASFSGVGLMSISLSELAFLNCSVLSLYSGSALNSPVFDAITVAAITTNSTLGIQTLRIVASSPMQIVTLGLSSSLNVFGNFVVESNQLISVHADIYSLTGSVFPM